MRCSRRSRPRAVDSFDLHPRTLERARDRKAAAAARTAAAAATAAASAAAADGWHGATRRMLGKRLALQAVAGKPSLRRFDSADFALAQHARRRAEAGGVGRPRLHRRITATSDALLPGESAQWLARMARQPAAAEEAAFEAKEDDGGPLAMPRPTKADDGRPPRPTMCRVDSMQLHRARLCRARTRRDPFAEVDDPAAPQVVAASDRPPAARVQRRRFFWRRPAARKFAKLRVALPPLAVAQGAERAERRHWARRAKEIFDAPLGAVGDCSGAPVSRSPAQQVQRRKYFGRAEGAVANKYRGLRVVLPSAGQVSLYDASPVAASGRARSASASSPAA